MAATGKSEFIGASAARLKPGAGVTAGPFEPVKPHRKGSGLGDALVTCLLIVYPAFATVAAVVVGFMLSGSGA